MTSATERIRAMLDERGVEWTVPDESWNQDSITYWKVGGIKWVAFESENDTLWLNCNSVTDLTPEQAITATLGRDQRNCHNISDFNPVDVFTCSECGSSFKVRQFKIDADGVLDDETEFEFVPMHCPWCGTKVVDE